MDALLGAFTVAEQYYLFSSSKTALQNITVRNPNTSDYSWHRLLQFSPFLVVVDTVKKKKEKSVSCLLQLERLVCFSNNSSFIICGLGSPPKCPFFY